MLGRGWIAAAVGMLRSWNVGALHQVFGMAGMRRVHGLGVGGGTHKDMFI